MCGIAEVGLALSIVKGVADFAGQRRAAKAEQRSIQQDDQFQAQGLANQQEEIETNRANDIADARREAMLLRGRIRVQQGESGGASAARLLRDAGFREGLQVATIDQNARRQLRQNRLSDSARSARTVNRYNEVRRPSLIETGLQIGQAGLDYYGATT